MGVMQSWLNGYGADANVCETDYSDNNFLDNAFSASEQAAFKSTYPMRIIQLMIQKTEKKNTAAQSLYGKLGYTEDELHLSKRIKK